MTREINFSDLCGFHEKQWLATETADSHEFTLYGGSRGPGKSYWLRWYPLRFLLMLANQGITNANFMLGCEDYPSLKDRQIGKIAAEFPGWLGTLRDTKEKGLGFHLHESYGSGSILLRNLDDPSKYMSAEFVGIAIDELTKNPKSTFDVLRGSLRWPGVPFTPFIGATNPAANWVRDYWIEKRLPDEMKGDEDKFAFVHALPDDNPHLDKAYWESLEKLPEALRRAWRYGDWYVSVEGLVYSTFNQDNITDMEPDPERPYELAIDDGYIDPRAVLFIQRSDTHILVFDEIYESQELAERTIERIQDMSEGAEWAEGRTGRLMPEMAAVSHEAVELRQRLRSADIPARNWLAKKAGGRTTSTRVEAINKTRALICDGNGKRSILVHKRCKHLLDEIMAGYKYKEGRHGLEDKPADGNDHAAQALESWVWLRA